VQRWTAIQRFRDIFKGFRPIMRRLFNVPPKMVKVMGVTVILTFGALVLGYRMIT
jgi:hypothetical protein